MQKTKFYQLNKPQLSDFANIEDAINPSMDIIDAKLKELSDGKVNAKTKIVQLSAGAFSGKNPYSARVEVEGLKASDTPIVGHKLQDGLTDAGVIKAAWKAYSCIDKIETYDGYMLVKCFRKQPMQDIWLAVKGG